MSKLTVHHLGVSQSIRVVWLCEELGIDYELKKYERSPIFSPPEIFKLHPLGSAPVITDDKITLAESEACIEYISHIHGNGKFFLPPGHKNYADFLYWYHFANGTLQPVIMNNMALMSASVPEDNPSRKRYEERRQSRFKFLDQRLSEATWLAGDEFTAADIMTVFSVTVMRCFYQYSLADYPNILAYLERVSQREAYRRSLEKGDPELDIEKLAGAAPPPLFKNLVPRK